jgi:hypothetical protein
MPEGRGAGVLGKRRWELKRIDFEREFYNWFWEGISVYVQVKETFMYKDEVGKESQGYFNCFFLRIMLFLAAFWGLSKLQ